METTVLSRTTERPPYYSCDVFTIGNGDYKKAFRSFKILF